MTSAVSSITAAACTCTPFPSCPTGGYTCAAAVKPGAGVPILPGKMTLQIKGFWLEEHARVSDPDFADALGKGLARFAEIVGNKRVDTVSITPKKLQRHIQKFIES